MKIAYLFLLVALVAASCQPEMSELTTGRYFSSTQDFQSKNQVTAQTTTVNASQTISFKGKSGSRFIFPSNAFVTLNNQPVTGNVNLEIKEILTPVEMILSNMPTMSDGRPLESGGQFFVRATQNNQELKLAPGKQIQIRTDTFPRPVQGMQVFNGTPINGSVNWQPNTNPGNLVQIDTLAHYTLFADNINWLNIDKFINQPVINYTVLPGNTPDFAQTLAFLHLTGRNSVLSIPKQSDKFGSNQLIAGPATLVAFCVKDGKLYASVSSINLQDGGTATLQFSLTDEASLKEKLKALR